MVAMHDSAAMVAAPLIDAGFGLDAAGEAGWDAESWEDVDSAGMLGGGIDTARPSVVCDLLAEGAAATAATVSFGFGDRTAAAACPARVFASTEGEGGAHGAHGATHGATHPGLAVGGALVFDGYAHAAAEVVAAIGSVDGGIRIVGSMMTRLHFQRLTAVGPQGIVLQVQWPRYCPFWGALSPFFARFHQRRCRSAIEQRRRHAA